MSIPSKHTTWGTLLYKKNLYSVLSFKLPKKISRKINEEGGLPYCSAPWNRQIDWEINNKGKLFLTRLYSKTYHRKIFNTDAPVAITSNMHIDILLKYCRICHTYTKRNAFANNLESKRLMFKHGKLFSETSKSEYYITIEPDDYIDESRLRAKRIGVLRYDSHDLYHYLYDGNMPSYDCYAQKALDFIETFIGKEKDQKMPLILKTLKQGDMALFGKVQGTEIEEMIVSLADTLTEGMLAVKGCLLHIAVSSHLTQNDTNCLVQTITTLLDTHLNHPHIGCNAETVDPTQWQHDLERLRYNKLNTPYFLDNIATKPTPSVMGVSVQHTLRKNEVRIGIMAVI